ncbi:MAG: UbiA family prenyltransferase [Candidatus Diapherotrites archaeon]|nr:UbiA family prenyltransferase [Candidatus Diapherotrites archaeon]
MSFIDYLKLLRPFNCILGSLAVWIGYTIAVHALLIPTISVLLAMLVVFLICGAGQVINDFFDVELDRKLNSEKPLPSGKISLQNAFSYSIGLFVIGNILAFFLGFTQFLIAVVFSVLLILYAWKISKNYKYIGNWVVALGTAFTLIYGASLANNYVLVIYFALSALFANLSRELIKDLEDVEKDQGFKKTLPMLLPKKEVKIYIGFFYFVSAILAFAVYVLFSLNFYFLILLGITILIFILSLKETVHENFKLAQRYSKNGMAIALLAFLVSVL